MKEAEPADYPEMLRIKEYNPDAEAISESLGITPERKKFIEERTAFAWLSSDSIVESAVKASKSVENAEELFWMSLLISQFKHGTKRPKDFLEKHESQDSNSVG